MARSRRGAAAGPIASPPKKKDALEQLISDIHGYNINHHTREIYLHGLGGATDEEPGVEYRMATMFVKNMHILGQQNQKNILVHMHTIGGCWHDGMAMFHAMRLARSTVTILSYAQASSMSGIILQAADKRVLMPECELMIHHGSIELADNSMAVKSAVDMNEAYCRRMLDIFAHRAVKGPWFVERDYNLSKVKSYIDRKIKNKSDWYLTSEEAVDLGFADGILGSPKFDNYSKIRQTRKCRDEI